MLISVSRVESDKLSKVYPLPCHFAVFLVASYSSILHNLVSLAASSSHPAGVTVTYLVGTKQWAIEPMLAALFMYLGNLFLPAYNLLTKSSEK
jgi:hypothetical protein